MDLTLRAAFLALSFSALCGQAALALDPAKALSQYTRDSWRSKEGLPQNSVPAVLQTRDGFLWLGTQEGLVRFDGASFEVFNKQNTPELGDNFVRVLVEDVAGNLWIGTNGGGLARFLDGAFTSYTTGQGLPSNRVLALAVDASDALWIGTDAGLAKLEGGHLSVFRKKDGLPSDLVPALCAGDSGSLWVGTDLGVIHYAAGKWVVSTTKDGLPNNRVWSLFLDSDGALWVGTDDGLACLKDARWKAFSTKDGLPNGRVTALQKDRDGNLWVGTPAGLSRLKDGLFSSSPETGGALGDMIEALYEDREGSLWIGTGSEGLNRLKDSKLTNFTVSEGLPNNKVRVVFQDHQGRVWAGTDGGVGVLENGQWSSFTTKQGLSNNEVTTIWEDKNQDLWVGTYGGGLNRIRKGRCTVYTTKQGLPYNVITSLFEDRSGAMWIGTGLGLSRMKDGKFTNYTTENGLSHNTLMFAHEDSAGNLWAGTYGGGLNRFKDGHFVAFTAKDGLSSDKVISIHEDREGVLWVGTLGGGLNRVKGGVCTSYSTKEGLFDDNIFQILEDAEANLWFSCHKGIFKVAKSQFEELARGSRKLLSCISYNKADGMGTDECAGGSQPAGWMTTDGKLWFPTLEGLATIDPAHILVNPVAPPTVIKVVLADGKKTDLRNSPRLRPGTRSIEIHYAGLSFLDPGRVAYMYKLEPFDPEWVEPGTRRTAYYTNLAPGRYRFLVTACNNDGVWSQTPASYDFYLEPRFYQTYWFFTLCALSGIVGTWGSYRLRVRQLKLREKVLRRLVDERTRELRENQQKLVFAEKMASLGRLSAGVAHEMNTPIAAVRASLNEMGKLVDETEASIGAAQVTDEDRREIAGDMKRSIRLATVATERAAGFVRSIKAQTRDLEAQEHVLFDCVPVIHDAILLLDHVLKNKHCTVSFNHPDSLELAGSPPRLAQVVTNLITNAIDAYAQKGGGPIRLSAEVIEGRVHMEVSDEGCGIPEENITRIFDPMFTTKPFGEGTGLGLSISRDIMTADFGGTMSASSRLGEGTTFHLNFPVSTEV